MTGFKLLCLYSLYKSQYNVKRFVLCRHIHMIQKSNTESDQQPLTTHSYNVWFFKITKRKKEPFYILKLFVLACINDHFNSFQSLKSTEFLPKNVFINILSSIYTNYVVVLLYYFKPNIIQNYNLFAIFYR